MVRGVVLLRAAMLVTAAVAPTPWLWGVAADAGRAAGRGMPLRPAEALTALAACGALAVLAALALGVLLELLSRVPGVVGGAARRVGAVVTPRLVRRAVGVALGAAVVAGVAPGAAAARPPAVRLAPAPPDPAFAPLPDPAWAPLSASPTPTPGWVPGAPAVRAQPDVRVLSPAPRVGVGTSGDAPLEVVVRRGDSLWTIAARHLGPDASEAEIARAWPAWFEANRDVVGDDPDLLHPGQRLHSPDVVPS